ncbi:MAG: hypothetical protein ABIA04_08360 [Pseudomonadota bacterium]
MNKNIKNILIFLLMLSCSLYAQSFPIPFGDRSNDAPKYEEEEPDAYVSFLLKIHEDLSYKDPLDFHGICELKEAYRSELSKLYNKCVDYAEDHGISYTERMDYHLDFEAEMYGAIWEEIMADNVLSYENYGQECFGPFCPNN